MDIGHSMTQWKLNENDVNSCKFIHAFVTLSLHDNVMKAGKPIYASDDITHLTVCLLALGDRLI